MVHLPDLDALAAFAPLQPSSAPSPSPSSPPLPRTTMVDAVVPDGTPPASRTGCQFAHCRAGQPGGRAGGSFLYVLTVRGHWSPSGGAGRRGSRVRGHGASQHARLLLGLGIGAGMLAPLLPPLAAAARGLLG